MPGLAPAGLPPLPRPGPRGRGAQPQARMRPRHLARWKGGLTSCPAGRGSSLPAWGAALCHLVLVVLRRRGKERWGDGRGDSGSGPPGHAHVPAGARPGLVGLGAGDWEEAPCQLESGVLRGCLPTQQEKVAGHC